MVGTTQHTILLSIATPIFAPVYLAKLRGGAFSRIDFKYAFQLRSDEVPAAGPASTTKEPDLLNERLNDDTLARAVLSKDLSMARYIAGIADPFRAFRVHTHGAMYATRVVAGLLRHQTLWLATDDQELKQLPRKDVARACDIIVSPQLYTSGFATLHRELTGEGADVLSKDQISSDGLTAYYPTERQTASSDPDLMDQHLLRVYHRTEPGWERDHYAAFKAKMPGRKLAYVTNNPLDHYGPLIQFASEPYAQDTLMTAFFAGNETLQDNRILFDDLSSDLLKALDLVRADPIGVAMELTRYTRETGDFNIDFSHSKVPHARLVNVLERACRDDVYSWDLKIDRKWLEKGVTLRHGFASMKDASDVDLDKEHPRRMFKERNWRKIKKNLFVDGVLEAAKKDSSQYYWSKPSGHVGNHDRGAALPHFARRSLQNYRDLASRHHSQRGAYALPDEQPRLPWIWPILALTFVLAGAIAPIDAIGSLFASQFGPPNAAAFIGPFAPFALAVAGLVVAGVSWMMRDPSDRPGVWVYDLTTLLALAVGLTTLLVAGIFSFEGFYGPAPGSGGSGHVPTDLTRSDRLAVAGIGITVLFVMVGTFVVATLERMRGAWGLLIDVAWRQRRALQRVKQAPLPEARPRYHFVERQHDYESYRPNWPEDFARQALSIAGIEGDLARGWTGTREGRLPVVVCIAAGTGKDARQFMELGCKVVLVEPNTGMLNKAREQLADHQVGQVKFVNAYGQDEDLPRKAGLQPGEADLIVVAQSIHVFRPEVADQDPPTERLERILADTRGFWRRAAIHLRLFLMGSFCPRKLSDLLGPRPTAHRARTVWRRLLRADGQRRLSIWYCNPDPKLPVTGQLDQLLRTKITSYADSRTPLLDAEWFRLNHILPWLSPGTVKLEDTQKDRDVDTRQIDPDGEQLMGWLNSYSFRPRLGYHRTQLANELAELLSQDGKPQPIHLPFKGFIVQGAIRPWWGRWAVRRIWHSRTWNDLLRQPTRLETRHATNMERSAEAGSS